MGPNDVPRFLDECIGKGYIVDSPFRFDILFHIMVEPFVILSILVLCIMIDLTLHFLT